MCVQTLASQHNAISIVHMCDFTQYQLVPNVCVVCTHVNKLDYTLKKAKNKKKSSSTNNRHTRKTNKRNWKVQTKLDQFCNRDENTVLWLHFKQLNMPFHLSRAILIWSRIRPTEKITENHNQTVFISRDGDVYMTMDDSHWSLSPPKKCFGPILVFGILFNSICAHECYWCYHNYTNKQTNTMTHNSCFNKSRKYLTQ